MAKRGRTKKAKRAGRARKTRRAAPRRGAPQPVVLKVAVGTYGHTQAIKDGSVGARGIKLDLVEVVPIVAAFRRMVRDLEFDVCELAPTTYLIARALGAPYIALPVFLMRRFHHGGLVCRGDAGIRQPKDLEGQKVGVRAYSVTTGVWTRGILANEYGVDTSKITWIVDDEEHVTQLELPPNVVHAAPGQSLVSLMAAGEIQAGFTAAAGIGRAGAPKPGWEAAQARTPEYHELFPDPARVEMEWFRRTKIYPIHGLVVVKESVLKKHKGVAKALFDMFVAAKKKYLPRLHSGDADGADDRRYRELMRIVGQDPLPYGFTANRPAIETMIDYAVQQGLMPKRLPLDRLFVRLEE